NKKENKSENKNSRHTSRASLSTSEVPAKDAITRPSSPDPRPTEGNIYVIVGSFSVESNATNYSKKLLSKGYQATTFKNKNGMTYTAIGGYKSEAAANETLKIVRE